MAKLRYIVTGMAFSGTTYCARLLTSVGIPCTHEAFFSGHGRHPNPWDRLKKVPIADAIADSNAWAAPFLDDPLLKDAVVIHLRREPMKVLRRHWRQFYCRPTDAMSHEVAQDNAILAACRLYIGHNTWIEDRDPMVVRIEDCPDALLAAVGKADATNYFVPKTASERNSRWDPQSYPFELTWDLVPEGDVKDRLAAMAQRYGYAVE